MREELSRLAKVLKLQPRKKNEVDPKMEELLKDREVQEFYKFVAEYDLRLDAIRLLDERLNKSDN